MARRPPIVTLTTDLGMAYAAQMKAVLYRTLPPGHVVDLVHDLPAHRVDEAAFLFDRLAFGFPQGTIHVAIVDPGVGSRRAPVVVDCTDGSRLVGPDNGLLSPLARHLGVDATYRILPERVRTGAAVSATFEGRDIFAPAAALLANGTPARHLGPATRLGSYEVPAATLGPTRALGQLLHIDRFGNAITNVPSTWASPGETIGVHRGARVRKLPVRRTYSELPVRGVGLLGSSFGLLELCAREARAADRLGLRVGDRIELRRARRPRRETVNIADPR